MSSESFQFIDPTIEDPLLQCLVIMTQLEHKPYSADALKFGLPLVEGRLTPELMERAAKQAGFSTKAVKRPLNKIPSIVLPVILILQDNQACVLHSINKKQGNATIIQPIGDKATQQQVTFEELNQLYTGFAFYLKKEFDFDSRATTKLLKNHSDHWFWGTLKQSGSIFRDVLIASFFVNLFVVATPLYIRNIYDRVIPNNAVETLWVLSLGVAVVFVFEFIFKSLRAHFIDVAGKKADIIISSLIFEKMMALKMSSRPHSVGALTDNMKSFESLKSFWTSATIALLIDIPFFFLFLWVIYLFAGLMFVIPAIAAIIIIFYSLLIRIPIKNRIRENYQASQQKQSTMIEGLSEVETIKTMGAEGHIQRKWEESTGFMAKQNLSIRILSQSVGNFASLISNFSTIAVMIIGINLVISHDLSSGSLIMCMMLSRRAISPMSKVANMVANYQQTKVTLDNLNQIMDLPVERPDGKKFVHRKEFSGKISFINVDFNYPKQKNKALTNVSFEIKPGEKVGLIGGIGSGKTTIQKLMLGLYEPSEGSVRFDDIDIAQIDPADLRRNIGYISQEISLFHGTVRDNISTKAPYVSDDELLRVATIAGVTDFTDNHPAGLDMPVYERGEGLSGGQKQSIAIARALLLNPPILLLDEPTSSMDNQSEAKLKERLKEIFVNKTIILVTHRNSVLSLIDRLIVMNKSRVQADGSKQAVLEGLKGNRIKTGKNKP